MGSTRKRSKRVHAESSDASEGDIDPESDYSVDINETHCRSESEKEGVGGSDADEQMEDRRDAEMEELEKQYLNLRSEEGNLLKNLKRQRDEDALRGQALKNQKALWDKTLEFRFLLQKAFSSSNKLPQEPIMSAFCNSNKEVSEAYLDLISSSKQTLSSMLELQEALLDKHPAILQGSNIESCNEESLSNDLKKERDEAWLDIHRMHCRIAPFRNNSVDKWQRKTQVTTGAAALKRKLHAFNQNISEQVAHYMRDPSRMIRRMQLTSPVGIFGNVPVNSGSMDSAAIGQEACGAWNYLAIRDEDTNGDPEVLDDSEFYQQLLKEFLESYDPESSEPAFYALKKPKKRKIVDKRASKSRKIRYNVHEKIVNFMAPVSMALPPMAPLLFENLFGMGNRKQPTTVR